MGSCGFNGFGGFNGFLWVRWVQWVLVGSGVFFVILNAVKNLSVRVDGRVIVDCRAIPENL